MARVYPFTEARHERWLKEDRGSGDGDTWNAWLHRGDFNSDGKATIDCFGANGREIHVFSGLERWAWLTNVSKRRVRKIHEQVPLDRDRTRKIARDIGVPHPRDPESGVDIVMTTDFAIWAVDANNCEVKILRSVKPESRLGDHNQMEHAEIERRYHLEDGHDFAFYSERSFSPSLLENVDLLYIHRSLHQEAEPLGYDGSFNYIAAEVEGEIHKCRSDARLFKFLSELNSKRGWPPGLATQVALNRIRWHHLRADYEKPLKLQSVAEISQATRALKVDDAAEKAA